MLYQHKKCNENTSATTKNTTKTLLDHKKRNEKKARRNRKCTEPVLYPFQIPTVNQLFFVNMY